MKPKNWTPKIKWTKGGIKLQQNEFGGWDVIERPLLATFITPSLKEVLRLFGENILILKAKGVKQIENDKEDLSELGINSYNEKRRYFFMNYDSSFNKINKHEKLTKQNVKRILNVLDKNKIVDCAVEFLMIKIEDEELKKIVKEYYNIKIGNNIFYAIFNSSMCEGERDREKWDSTPYNDEVLKDLGFKHTVLHCIKLIDDGQIWNLKRSRRKYFINWEPKDYRERTSPEEIAHSLMDNLKPYGYVKKYNISKNEKLMLVSMK